MAISFAQYTQEAARRRSMAYQQENAAVGMPMPEHFQHQQHTYQHPYFQQTYPPPPPPQNVPYQYQQPQPNYFAQQPPAYHEKPLHPTIQEYHPPPPPPRPPKTPLDDNPPSLPPRPASTLSPTTSHSSTPSTTITPDPLPPHSNPQTLTATQSLAFSNSHPIPPVRLAHEEIYNASTGYADYILTRSSSSTLLSNKNHLTITPTTSTSQPLGYIKFHTLSSSSIELYLRGRETTISHSVISNKWSFVSITSNGGQEKWYWKSDKSTGGAKLETKKGVTLARMRGDLLSFEQGRLGREMFEEVLLSAVAMAEAARRSVRRGTGGEVRDLAGAVGDFAGLGGDGRGYR